VVRQADVMVDARGPMRSAQRLAVVALLEVSPYGGTAQVRRSKVIVLASTWLSVGYARDG
jgi:hypothetical protein